MRDDRSRESSPGGPQESWQSPEEEDKQQILQAEAACQPPEDDDGEKKDPEHEPESKAAAAGCSSLPASLPGEDTAVCPQESYSEDRPQENRPATTGKNRDAHSTSDTGHGGRGDSVAVGRVKGF